MNRFATAALILFSVSAPLAFARTQTDTLLSTSSQSPAFGSALTLTGTVVNDGGGSNISSGAVTFYDGVRILGSAPVSNSTATLTTNSLSPGAHSLYARYTGTSDFAPSVSRTLTVTVIASPGGSTINPSNPPTGTTPSAIAYGDFNKDGITDLVTANRGSNDVTVLLGRGDGTYQSGVSYLTGTGPNDVAVVDVDLDGNQDLVVADQGGNTIAVLLGTATGQFHASVFINTVGSPRSLAVGDFNGDGLPDIAVTSTTSNQVGIMFNTGTVTLFGAPVVYSLPDAPKGLAVGDFNGDGIPDLAVADYSTDNFVSVFLGSADGALSGPTNYPVGAGPVAVAVGDFNNDGHVDLAVANSVGGTVSILLGTGTGTFGSSSDFPAGDGPYALVTSDFNADGKPDLAVVDADAGTLSLLIGNGDGTLQAPSPISVGSSPSGVVATALDGDSIVDLAVSNSGSNTVSVLLGAALSSVTLVPSPNPALEGTPVTLTATVAPSNANGSVIFFDGSTALATVPVVNGVATYTTSSLSVGSHVLTATFTGNFASSTSPPVTEIITTGSIITFSINPNPTAYGQPVTLSASVQPSTSSGTVTFYYGTTVIGVAPVVNGVATLVTTQLPAGPLLIEARYSGGGSNGSAVAPTQNMLVAATPGGGYSATPPVIPVGANPDAVVTADFNGDGLTDVATANYSAGTVTVLLGTGAGTFSAPLTVTVGSNPAGIAVADFNGDGKPDLVVTNRASNTVSVLIGNGDGTFQPAVNLPAAESPIGVTSADFNGDGAVDFAVALSNTNQVAIFLGNGDGTFQAPSFLTFGNGLYAITTGDFNGDGIADLAVTGGAGVYVLLGNGNATFESPVNYATGAGPIAVAAVDLTGSGRANLIVVNSVSNSVTVLTSNSSGQFAPGVSYATGTFPQGIVVSDFNGDGKFDLAIPNEASNNISVFLGNGDGTFQPQALYSVGDNPNSLAAGSFTTDGRVDLIVTQSTQNQIDVLIALQASSTSLSATPNPDTAAEPVQLTATVTPSTATGTVTFYDGTAPVGSAPLSGGTASILVTLPAGAQSLTAVYGGDATFGSSTSAPVVDEIALTPTSVSVSAVPNATLLGQSLTLTATVSNPAVTGSVTFYNGSTIIGISPVVNGVATLTTNLLPTGTLSITARFDGDSANAISTSAPAPVTVAPQRAFSLSAPAIIPAGIGPVSVAVSDFNGDGKLDLAVANTGLSILIGNGDGSFTAGASLAAGTTPAQVVTSDFNADGRSDIAVVNSGSNNISIFTGNGNGTFQNAVNYAAGTSPSSVTVADFNGDGKADLAIADRGAPTVTILIGNGDGTFYGGNPVSVGGANVGITAGDFNGDGIADLAVLDANNNVVWILIGSGSGTFAPGVSFAVGTTPTGIAAADLNFDGKTDLVVSNAGSANVAVLLGQGNGQFQLPVYYAVGSAAEAIAIGDFNGDGVADLAVANQGGGVSVLIGSGSGAFAPAVNYGTGASLTSLALGNFTGDSTEQVVAASPSTNSVEEFLGGPATITVASGNSQTAALGSSFAAPLAVTVSGFGQPDSNVSVTFTAPSSGASGSFAGAGLVDTVLTNTSGVATSSVFSANNIAGGYNVVAAVGAASTAFTLTNAASACTYTVSTANTTPGTIGFPQEGGSVTVNVSTSGPSCAWSVSPGAGWFTVSSSGGTGAGSITVSAGPNSTGTALSSTILVAGVSIQVIENITSQVFQDLPPGSFGFDAANLLYAKGITTGCNASPLQYCPNQSITRAQMAVFIVRSIFGSATFNYPSTPYFNDVPQGSFAFSYIQEMAQLGITSGCGNGNFCPDSSVTRDEMAVFLIKMRYGPIVFDYPPTPYFTDVPNTDFAFVFVQRLAEDGITTGCGTGLYCPSQAVTRAQMAIFIIRAAFNQLFSTAVPYISQISPAVFTPGQVATVTVTGVNTNFVQNSSVFGYINGITWSNINVTSPTTLTATVTISSTIPVQPYPVQVITGTEEAILPNGLVIQPAP